MTLGVPDLVGLASADTGAAYFAAVQALVQASEAATAGSNVAEAQRRLNDVIKTSLDRMAPGRAAARQEMIAALQQTAPSAALIPLRDRQAQPIGSADTSRFMWLLAVSGEGKSGGLDSWNRYAQAAQRWLAEFIASSTVKAILDDALTGIERSAQIGRLFEHSTRLRWVSDMICTLLGAWADSSVEATMFGPAAMSAVNRSVELLIGHQGGVADTTTFQGIPGALVTQLTAKRDSPTRFEELLFSSESQSRPLVEVDGVLHAVNTSDWYIGREVAILAAMREVLGSAAIGDAYEAAVVGLTRRIAPAGISVFSSVHLARPEKSAKNGDQVDFILTGDDLLVVGEAKSYVPARQPRAVANSYTTQVLHSVGQLNTRLQHLAEGYKVIGHPETGSSASVYGISLPLHDYGGTTWRGDAMEQAEVPLQLIMPLHGYALALSCLKDCSDLTGYLTYRSATLAAPYAGLDELEPLIAWISGVASASTVLPEGYRAGVYRAYELRSQITLSHPGPANRDQWIKDVYDNAVPVDGDPLAQPDEYLIDLSNVFDRLDAHVHDSIVNGGPFSLAQATSMPSWLRIWEAAELASATVLVTVNAARNLLPPGPLTAERPPANAVEKEALRLLTVQGGPEAWEPNPKMLNAPGSISQLILSVVDHARRNRVREGPASG